MMLFIIATLILALVAATLANAGEIQILCNRGSDYHCVYTPVAGELQQNKDKKPIKPGVTVYTGSIYKTDVDGAGSTTFVVKDGAQLDVTIPCQQGGPQKFSLKFAYASSQLAVDQGGKGQASAYFNDDVSKVAKVGQAIESSAVGVDATLSCH